MFNAGEILNALGGNGGLGGYEVDRSGWAKKSRAAEVREQEAKDAFMEMKQEVEKQGAAVVGRNFLKPSTHLTTACWNDFKAFVKKNPGWKVYRRQASPMEKRANRVSRKGSAYFIDVSYTPPGTMSAKLVHPQASTEVPPAKRVKTSNVIKTPQWASALDPATGKTYYYNRETRLSQWEKPKYFEIATAAP